VCKVALRFVFTIEVLDPITVGGAQKGIYNVYKNKIKKTAIISIQSVRKCDAMVT